jgi:hypothetical protein
MEMASFTAEQFRSLLDAMKLIEGVLQEEMALPPDLEQYITKNPQTVGTDIEALLAPLRDEARNGSMFMWGIAQLPDGRYVECSPRAAARWGLKIVQKGDNESLRNQ